MKATKNNAGFDALLDLALFTEEGVTNAESEKKPGSDQHGSTRTDDLLPHQQARQACSETVERRRKRKRELKSKTYMDDQGFMGKGSNITVRFLVDIRELKQARF